MISEQDRDRIVWMTIREAIQEGQHFDSRVGTVQDVTAGKLAQNIVDALAREGFEIREKTSG